MEPNSVYCEWQASPLGRMLPELFDIMKEQQIYDIKNRRSATTGIVWIDKTPLTNEELQNFIEIHKMTNEETQDLLKNIELMKIYSNRIAPGRNREPINPNGIVDDQFSYRNLNEPSAFAMPQIMGKPRLTGKDVRDSIHKSLQESVFTPMNTGYYQYVTPGAMYTPSYIPPIQPISIQLQKERFDRLMSDAHGVFLSGSKSTVKNGAESLKLEMQRNKDQLDSIRTLIEKWMSELLNLIYAEDVNSELFEAIDTSDQKVIPEDIENDSGDTNFNRILLKFVPKWPVDEKILGDIWAGNIFDVELMQELYSRVCDIDPGQVEWYNQNPSKKQKEKDGKLQNMTEKRPNSEIQHEDEGENQNHGKGKAKKKKKETLTKEDSTPSDRGILDGEEES